VQERVETPMTAAKQERIDAARAQFDAARLAIEAQLRLFEGFGLVDVTARGDDLQGKTTLEISVTGIP
jgi:hypothetical protein